VILFLAYIYFYLFFEVFGLPKQADAIFFHTLRTNENLTIAPVSQQLVKLFLFIFIHGFNCNINTLTNKTCKTLQLSQKNYRARLRPSPCRRGVEGEV